MYCPRNRGFSLPFLRTILLKPSKKLIEFSLKWTDMTKPAEDEHEDADDAVDEEVVHTAVGKELAALIGTFTLLFNPVPEMGCFWSLVVEDGGWVLAGSLPGKQVGSLTQFSSQFLFASQTRFCSHKMLKNNINGR